MGSPTIRGGHNERSWTSEEKAAIQEELLEMFACRYKFHEIVRKTQNRYDLSEPTISMWLKEAIRKQELPDPAFALRRDMILVDHAIAALIPKVMEGVPTAHVALERWLNRRAKWLGLDAPEKIEAIVKNIHTGPIDEEIKELSERLGLQPPRELPSA